MARAACRTSDTGSAAASTDRTGNVAGRVFCLPATFPDPAGQATIGQTARFHPLFSVPVLQADASASAFFPLPGGGASAKTGPMRTLPDFSFEEAARLAGAIRIAGVDEVGRGPLAGPVTAAAVILDPARIPAGLNDSKVLTAARRGALAIDIAAAAMVSVAHASVEEIDALNILRASHLAMCRAVAGMPMVPDYLLIDGNLIPRDIACRAEAIVKGDARCLSIAAASIMAKVARDAIMVDLAQQYPAYGWERNAGYPTQAHLTVLKRHGATPHHRRSFAPVHNIL
jgi:ribonuclease HII